MEGTYGRVYRGSYHEEGAVTPRDVLVKTAAENASQAQVILVSHQNHSNTQTSFIQIYIFSQIL